ncbi:MAG: ectoine/hydroxyectoine ABC transporter permease subunit EhuC, partial [Solirubrobacteraceae bacterium]
VVRSSTGETALIFGLILVIYFVLASALALFWRGLERRARLDGRVETRRVQSWRHQIAAGGGNPPA